MRIRKIRYRYIRNVEVKDECEIYRVNFANGYIHLTFQQFEWKLTHFIKFRITHNTRGIKIFFCKTDV